MKRKIKMIVSISCIIILIAMVSFTPTTARIDLTGSWHPTSVGNPFDQDLNTTDSPTFDDLDVTDRLDVGGDIVAVDDIWCDVAYTRMVGIESSLYHVGDPDTYMHFNADEIYFTVDGRKVFELENETSAFYNNVTIAENLTVTDNITANFINATGGFLTGDGSGWSGWIDDGINTNCTYSGGILIAVVATSGVAGFNEA